MASRTRSSSAHGRPARGASHQTSAAREHYRREKARRDRQPRPDDELLQAAKREYLALLEAEAAKGKGGRPKKNAGATRRRAPAPRDPDVQSDDRAQRAEDSGVPPEDNEG